MSAPSTSTVETLVSDHEGKHLYTAEGGQCSGDVDGDGISPIATSKRKRQSPTHGRSLSMTFPPVPGGGGRPRPTPLQGGSASLDRLPSRPFVGPFGGVAPEGLDAEEGLVPATSREEEIERNLEREEKGPDPWAVKFEPGEKANPKNWGVAYRWVLTVIASILVLNSTFASSAPSGIMPATMAYFHISQEVATLCMSLFVAGYMVGPLLWGPLSETYGRRPMFVISFIVYTCFQVGCALSKNTASILIFRFFSGTFAAAPLTNSGALLADVWDSDRRGRAMAMFSLAPFAGPCLGPIVSGFIYVSGTSWRWVYWVTTIFAGVCTLVIIFFLPETYSPVLLKRKAKRLRKETGDDRWYAPIERRSTSWKTQLYAILLKPFVMLIQEPVLLCITFYMAFIYGLLYLLFTAYPFVFIQKHHFNEGENGLAFLGFFVGGLIATLVFMFFIEPRYQRHAHRIAPAFPAPERRLEMAVVSSWCLVGSMFWFAWTSYASVAWIVPILAGALTGFSLLGMFVSLFNYVIDCYLWSAATALTAVTVVRSAAGAG